MKILKLKKQTEDYDELVKCGFKEGDYVDWLNRETYVIEVMDSEKIIMKELGYLEESAYPNRG